jgi:flavin reductase (DIM6/NTAB) family NADH-FMN oxidoreductase RutF
MCHHRWMHPVTPEEFGGFVEGLDGPMYVVTATDGAEASGCLVGFATQTSIDPPRMLVCLSEENHTLRVALAAELLAVHRLDKDEHGLAELFGGETGDRTDKFASCSWAAGPGGVPLLEGVDVMVGRILGHRPVGDHVGFLLEPVALRSGGRGSAAGPLTLLDVDDVEPGHPA